MENIRGLVRLVRPSLHAKLTTVNDNLLHRTSLTIWKIKVDSDLRPVISTIVTRTHIDFHDNPTNMVST